MSNYNSLNNEKLSMVIKRAKEIAKNHGNDGLHDLIQALLYPTMYKHLYDCITSQDDNAPNKLNPCDLFPMSKQFYKSNSVNVKDRINSNYIINLAYDLVFTTPWSKTGLVSHPGGIGHKVPFTEDITNHYLTVFYPMRIAFVDSGNHSIMQGILTGKGIIHVLTYYDLSGELKKYSYQGANWINNETGETIEIKNHDIGLVWEVSKFLIQ